MAWRGAVAGPFRLPREGDLGDEAALAVNEVLDRHGAAVGQQHVVFALHATRLVPHLVLAVVVLGLGVVHLPLELVLGNRTTRRLGVVHILPNDTSVILCERPLS